MSAKASLAIQCRMVSSLIKEDKAKSDIERQTMRLHAANILIKQGKLDYATTLLNTITETGLQEQRQKLVAQIAEKAKK